MTLPDIDENIGKVTLDPETKHINQIIFYQTRLRFRCRRCAIFCCRLGGPKLTLSDVERIEKEGYSLEDVVERPSNREFENLPVTCDILKSEEDGSCVFLKFDEKRRVHTCLIYEVRPALCKLYPFGFEKVSPYSFVLKLIPCCRGLNDPRGELVDKEFVANRLLLAILDLMTERNMAANKLLI